MSNLVARLLSLGLTLGVSTLTCLVMSPLSAAQAAYPAWSGTVSQPKRPYFRPVSSSERRPMTPRWRPQASAGSRAATVASTSRAGAASYPRRQTRPVFSLQRTPPRKAVPAGRGSQLGLRFRPDGRASTGDAASTAPAAHDRRYPASLHAQFRPVPRAPRPRYEALQARNSAGLPMRGVPPLVRYGYWPHWR